MKKLSSILIFLFIITHHLDADLYILIGPSGVGKTTLIRNILSRESHFNELVLHTTRPARTGETHGKDYYFIDYNEFKEKESKKKFILSNEVHKNWYGISSQYTQRILHKNDDLIGNLSTQAALEIKKLYQEKVKTIFISPPSFDVLKQRLLNREKLMTEAVKLRLHNAQAELQQQDVFDYKIINDNLDNALSELHSIIAQKLKDPLSNKQH